MQSTKGTPRCPREAAASRPWTSVDSRILVHSLPANHFAAVAAENARFGGGARFANRTLDNRRASNRLA